MKTVFIAGCGYVGLAVARLLEEAGWEVIAGTHSEESAQRLSGERFEVIVADLCDRAGLAALPILKGRDVVVHCASSGRGGVEQYRRVYLEGARNLLEVLAPGRLLYTG